MTLKEALEIVLKEGLEDAVYRVRERAGEEDSVFVGNSWHHPRVLAYSDAVMRLKKELASLS